MAENNRDLSYDSEDMENGQNEILTYQARKGTDSQGFIYEENMAALYALKFSLNADVKNVLMASNVNGFDALDDLVLRVEYHTGKQCLYLIQLKHKENENYNIKTSDLSAKRNGMFSLEKYKKSYESVISKFGEDDSCLTKNISVNDVRVCLVTNANLQNITTVSLESTNVNRYLIPNQDLIDTKPGNSNTFDIDNPTRTILHEYSTFFQYFRFYDRQVNCKEAKTEIKCLLKSRLEIENNDVVEKFIKFTTGWFKQERVLTKKIVKNKLLRLVTEITDKTQLYNKYKIFEDLTDINDYDQRVKILKEVKISIQGRSPLSLYELTNRKFHETVPALFLLKNIKETVDVGRKGLEKPENYIRRRFLKTLLSINVLSQTRKNIFLFSTPLTFHIMSEIQILNDLRTTSFLSSRFTDLNIAIYVAENEFTETINHIKKHKDLKTFSLHQVKEHDKWCLEWLRSWSDTENLCPFIEYENSLRYSSLTKKLNDSVEETEALQYFKSTLNIVSAIPGMGKTTILNSLADYCKPDVLALRLDLNTHENNLRDENSELRRDPLKYILERMISGKNSEFEEKLFDYLKEENRLILFVDAFDEISPTHTDAVLAIIEKLKEKQIQLWIFTRPVAKSVLEKRFNVIPIQIVSLEKHELYDYLVKAVGQEREEVVSSFLNKNFHNVHGSPLYLHMLFTLFKERCLNIQDLKITDLYDNYIEMSFQKHIEKRNIEGNANSTRDLVESFKSEYLKVHKTAALVAIFGKDYLLENKILKPKKLESIRDFKIGRKNYELIVSADDERPIFSHRTFAEYFAAIQIYEYLQSQKFQVLYKLLFQRQYKEVRVMFDRITAKALPIHLAVAEEDTDKLKALCKDSQGSKMFETDEFCRTALHFAVNYGTHYIDPDYQIFVILDLLMQHFKNSEIILMQRDRILNLNFYEQWNQWNQFGIQCLFHLAATWKLTNIVDALSYADDIRNDVNKISELGLTPIHCAAEVGFIYAIQVFKTNGGDIEKVNRYGETALHLAVARENTECVDFLIKEGANVHCREKYLSCTPIHYAAKTGNIRIIKQLIEAGGIDGIDDIDGKGRTALHYACQYEEEESAYYFIELGFDVNKRDHEGRTPMHYAAENGHANIIKLLKENGGKIDDVYYAPECEFEDGGEKSGHTEYYASENRLRHRTKRTCDWNDGTTPVHDSAEEGNVDELKYLIDNGGSIYETDLMGKTPLHYASKLGHTKCVECLLNEIPNSEELISYVNQKDICGRTSMHLAASNLYVHAIKLLKEKGGRIHDIDEFGATALHHAVSHRNLYRFLVEKKKWRLIDDEIKENEYTDCIKYLLKESSKLEMLNLFVNQKTIFGRTAMHSAATNEYINAIELFIQHGGRIDDIDLLGTTAVHLAALNGNKNCVCYLIQAGVDINKKAIDGSTLIHFCAEKGYTNIIRVLKQKGGNINEINLFGENCLHYASSKGHIECIQYLLEEGLEVNQKTCRTKLPLPDKLRSLSKEFEEKDNDSQLEEKSLAYIKAVRYKEESAFDRTPMHYAAAGGHVEVMKLLAEKAGGLNNTDSEGRTSSHYAAYNGNVECLDYLLNSGADIHQQAKDGRTVIHCATENGDAKLIGFLNSKGIDVNKINSEGEKPVQTATKGRRKTLECLIQNSLYHKVQYL